MFSGYICCLLLVVFVGQFSHAVTGEIPGLNVLPGPVLCRRSSPAPQVYPADKGAGQKERLQVYPADKGAGQKERLQVYPADKGAGQKERLFTTTDD